MNVLVTGATGFIGINLIVKLLSDKDNHIVAVIRPDSSKRSLLPSNERLSVVECSLDNIDELPNMLNRHIDVFYHLAWDGIRNTERENKQLQQSDYRNSINAIHIAKVLGANVFIGTGSQAEYGICKGKISEAYSAHPISEYGKAKLKVCEEGQTIAAGYGMRFVWTRIFSIYGTGDDERTLISTVLSKMIKNEPIPLTECIQKWDFTHISDVVKALILLQNAPTGVYNIASGETRDLREFIYEMIDITHSKSELQFGAISYGSDGIGGFEPISLKLQITVGWHPDISFTKGIQKLVSEVIKIM